MQTKHRMFCV